MRKCIRPYSWLLGLGAFVGSLGAAYAQDAPPPPPPQEGVEVLARGQVHEAFAEPGAAQPKPSPIVAKQPPNPVNELPPDQKPDGANIQWISGYWDWDEDGSNFIWISGFWRATPPNRQWVPGYWAKADGGYQRVPGYWAGASQADVQFVPQPPDPIEAAVPPAPDDTSTFVAGAWVYRDTQFAWRPGYWVRYSPNWVWVPATYVWTPSGYIMIDGYWDYALASRGLLFAPVQFQQGFFTNPDRAYTPSYVVSDNALLSALFVRPQYRHYYFGDYYAANYGGQGFIPWVNYRSDRVGYDPLFSYYRVANRDDRNWVSNLVKVYDGRVAGDFPRPARTLTQQNTLVQNITTNKTTNTTINSGSVTNLRNVSNSVRNVTLVAPLAQVDRGVVKLKPLTAAQVATEGKVSHLWQETAQERARTESQLHEKSPAPKVGEKPLSASFTVPPALQSYRSKETKPAPKPEPRPEARPEPKPEPKPEVRPEPKPEVRPTPKPELRPEPKPEPKPEVKPEPKPEVRPEPKPRPEVKPEPKPEPKPEVRPTPRPEVRPEPKPEPKPEPRPEVRPTPRPEVKPEPKPEPKPEVRPTPRPEVRPEPKPEPKPVPPGTKPPQ